MAQNNKIQMPSSMGGIVRYSDEYKSKWEFRPGTVVIMVIVVIIAMIILNTYGSLMLG